MTNTILVSQTLGIHVRSSGMAKLETTLWGAGAWANATDWSGDGTIITGTHNYWGDPAYMDPDARDYHIRPSSAAIDTGVNADVITDIDGDPRPLGAGYDIGADEYHGLALAVIQRADPDPVRSGEQLTYTLRATNTNNVDLHATITDTLPDHVTPTGVLTWTATITTSGGAWTQSVVVTVTRGYSGMLTNRVEVTTAEGATGEAQVTVNAIGYRIYLPIVLRN